MSDDVRAGEKTLPFDPGAREDAALAFIGVIRSPWTPADCPKNIRAARAQGKPARIELRDGYAPGLTGLAVGEPIVLLYWAGDGRRDLILQAPGHTDGPRGTFALRSPRRPNPVIVSTVIVTSLDAAAGVIGIDAIDAHDGTPVIDIKPWIETVDLPPSRQSA